LQPFILELATEDVLQTDRQVDIQTGRHTDR